MTSSIGSGTVSNDYTNGRGRQMLYYVYLTSSSTPAIVLPMTITYTARRMDSYYRRPSGGASRLVWCAS